MAYKSGYSKGGTKRGPGAKMGMSSYGNGNSKGQVKAASGGGRKSGGSALNKSMHRKGVNT